MAGVEHVMSLARRHLAWTLLLLGLAVPACQHLGEGSAIDVEIGVGPRPKTSEAARPPVPQVTQFPTVPEPSAVLHLPADEPPMPAAPEPPTLQVQTEKPEKPQELPPPSDDLPPPAPPAPPEPELHPLARALRAFQDDRPAEAVKILSIYEPKDQELLLRLLPLLARVEKGGLLTDRLTTEEKLTLLDVLRSLSADLRVAAPLVIDKLYFCSEVRGFGQADPFPASVFRPGDRLAIYAEILNLSERRQAEDQYLTHISSRLEIRDASGKKVWSPPPQDAQSTSRSPRHDHFTVINFRMPRDLEPGVYTLRLELTDRQTRRAAEKHLGFRIGSIPAAASRMP